MNETTYFASGMNLHRVFLAVTNQSLGNFVVSPISKRVDCWQTRRVGEDYSIYSTVYPRAPPRRSTQAHLSHGLHI